MLARARPPALRPVERASAGRFPLQLESGSNVADVVRRGSCLELKPSADAALAVIIPAHGIGLRIASGAIATLSLRRFGDAFGVALGTLPAGSTTRLLIPADAAPAPWHARLTTLGGPTTVCP